MIRRIREECGDECTIMAVMSGNYVQRGEPAMLNKYLRAAAAVSAAADGGGGPDLVLELPYPWCCGTAGSFAGAALSIILRCGAVEELAFGCECGSFRQLQQVADRLDEPTLIHAMAEAANPALAGPVLRQHVYETLYGEPFPTAPNDILGVEYLRAMKRQGGNLTIRAVPRESDGFSAGQARRSVLRKDSPQLFRLLPEETLQALKEADSMGRIMTLERMELMIRTHFRRYAEHPERLTVTDGMTLDLARRFCMVVREAEPGALFQCCATKKYTNAHLKRTALHSLIGVTTSMLTEMPAFSTVLAMNERGRRLLARMRKSSAIPLMTRPGKALSRQREVRDSLAAAQFSVENLADDLYAFAAGMEGSAFLKMIPSRSLVE